MRGVLWTWAAVSATACALAQAQPDFSKDVQPLLARKCVMCHNEKMAQNGLRFDDADAALAGGYSGPVIVAGKSAESKLITRVSSTKKGFMMPPAGAPLSPAEIDTLKSWIDAGAVWPRTAKTAAPKPKSSHWAFQPITRPDPPATRNHTWARNTIDKFVLARLEAEGITPSPEASKTTLIRRATLDLTGLPPSPAEVQDFLADSRADSYERLVDRLLQSPHYGEQRARQWLDLARYADSDGYEKDVVRPYAWRWRSYVIDSFNRDLPFDQFTIEQLAGDLLPAPAQEQLVATGFHRNSLTNREGGVDRAENRFDQLSNRTATTGTVWLGLTVACSQCHDHKYDPIKQKDYYSLYAFFNRSDEVDIDAPLPGEMGAWMRARPAYLQRRAHLLKVYDVERLQDEWEHRMLAAANNLGQDLEWDFERSATLTMFDGFETILRTSKEKRSRKDQERMMYWFINHTGPTKGREVIALESIRNDCRRRLRALDADQPKLTQSLAMMELPQPPQTHIAVKGDYREPGVKVEPDTPAFLPPLPASAPRNRLTLARWLVARENPLTARVAVNRLWQDIFGRGIVRTSEDFGTQGDKPSHPELLDWLASDFRDEGWSVKRTLRLILTSAAYRQSSTVRKELQEKDPENVLLARAPRVRMPAESIRDAALAASGLLNPTIGGPSVHPPQPAGVAELGYADSIKWTNDEGPERYRRGLYIHFQRTTPYPMLMNFDTPDSNVACARRRRSNSPLQALNLLNDPVFFEAAQAFALRLARESKPEERLDYAFSLALARKPTARERERMQRFLDQQATELSAHQDQAKLILPLAPADAAWVGAARVLLNLDEFITRE
ncbi:MAG: PSD1 domain-containing protein [Bryobacterales bacterium]|nr:PSD1 domain-containing protein [Bryobacterales bacterium]